MMSLPQSSTRYVLSLSDNAKSQDALHSYIIILSPMLKKHNQKSIRYEITPSCTVMQSTG